MTTIVRAATAGDLHKLALYERQLYGAEGYPELLFYQALRQWPQLLLVAQSDDTVSGYSMMAPLPQQRASLMSLLVASDYRQLGIGRLLLLHSLQVATEHGFGEMELSVSPQNDKAINLYQKSGFVIYDDVPDYLGPGEHRLIMQRTL